MAGEISFRLEDSLFQKALYDLAQATNKPFAEVVKGNGRLIAVNLAFQTQPYGDDASAKEKGEAAVRRDIRMVFADAPATYRQMYAEDKAMAAAFYKAMLQKDWKEARRILYTSSSRWRNVEIAAFTESLHRKSRNNRGRVTRHVPAQIITTGGRKLDSYIAKKVRLVGFAKAGWAAAAMKLSGNTRGIPQFVTRHKAVAPGSVVDHSTSWSSPHVLLRNEVKYIGTVCTQSQIGEALGIQREKMTASIAKVVERSTRRFNNMR